MGFFGLLCMQGDLILLLDKMIDDFKSRWGDELRYSYETRRGNRNIGQWP